MNTIVSREAHRLAEHYHAPISVLREPYSPNLTLVVGLARDAIYIARPGGSIP